MGDTASDGTLWDWLASRSLAAKLALLYGGVGVLQVTVRLLRSIMRVRRTRKMLEPVPQARFTSGFLGALPDLLRNAHRLHDWRIEATRGFPVCKLWGPLVDPNGVALVINDPVSVRYFLKDNFNNYTKATDEQEAVMMYLRKWLGDGIFTTTHGAGSSDGGRSWTLQRKIAANIFTRSNFNNLMQEVFQAKSERLCGELSKRAADGQPVDMQCQFFNFTMDSIMQIFFGEDSDTLGGAPHRYGEAFDTAHNNMFDYVLHARSFMFLTQFFLPWPIGGRNGLAWRLHAALSPTCRRFQAACRILDEESNRLVRACRADPALASRRDLLALFVQAEEKQHFSPKFLRDVVLNFVIAGRDTTACLLSWMFFELARNPDIQKRLCSEIDGKVPAEACVLNLKGVSHSEMPYLHAVIYETLRLWPPVPLDAKVAFDDDVLPDGTKIPAGCRLVFLPFAMGRDPQLWPEPERFKPERWIPFSAPAPHEFPVFQAGPRICLGMDMAIFEAKVVTCNLLRHFSFGLPPGEAEKVTYSKKLTMSISNSKGQVHDNEQLMMLVQRRQKA